MWPIFVVNGPNQKQVSWKHYYDQSFYVYCISNEITCRSPGK